MRSGIGDEHRCRNKDNGKDAKARAVAQNSNVSAARRRLAADAREQVDDEPTGETAENGTEYVEIHGVRTLVTRITLRRQV
jgi:hypothetical protein